MMLNYMSMPQKSELAEVDFEPYIELQTQMAAISFEHKEYAAYQAKDFIKGRKANAGKL